MYITFWFNNILQIHKYKDRRKKCEGDLEKEEGISL